MAGFAAKLADRFKPGIFDRLKQSKEAKALRRNVAVPKTQTVIDIETRAEQYSPTGRILESQTIFTEPTGFYRKEQIWREWTTGNTITACTTCDDTWNIWHADTGTSAATTTWNTWNTGSSVIIRTSNVLSSAAWETWQDQPQPHFNGHRRLTAAERRAQEEREAQWQRERLEQDARYRAEEQERQAKKKLADDRAMLLLVSMLNDQQRNDLKRDKHFFVDAPSGRLYRIDYGTHGNVKVVDRQTRKIIERLCIQPNGVPAGDANLMQKLMIETAEETFRAHANITLENGSMVYGKRELLDNAELAKVIPFRKAA